jgi:hypothetical protein
MSENESYLTIAFISLAVSTIVVFANHYILKRCRKYNQQFIDEELTNEDDQSNIEADHSINEDEKNYGSGLEGGKAKPPKREQKEMNEEDLVFIAKQQADMEKLKKLREEMKIRNGLKNK